LDAALRVLQDLGARGIEDELEVGIAACRRPHAKEFQSLRKHAGQNSGGGGNPIESARGFGHQDPGIDDILLLSEDAMARAVITTDFASPAETARVLGVSRANRERLVRMAELAISRTGSRRGKAKSNGARTISRRARKRR